MNDVDSIRLARNAPGIALHDGTAQPDMRRMRAYRLGRIQEQLRKRDLAGIILYDPVNVRYATGSSNMNVWMLHNQKRYCWVPADGATTLYEYKQAMHLSEHLETIKEIRPAVTWTYFGAGNHAPARAQTWVEELHALIRSESGDNQRIAADHMDPMGSHGLEALGYELHDGQEVMELARSIKSDDEINCMQIAISVCEAGMAKMREELKPGITENQLWSHLHQVNIAMGGEWIETRLLASGGRTNPWFQECNDRIIRAGELVAFDTDLIGPFGYCADISRTYFCGPGRPTDEQKRLYQTAYDQIQHNIGAIRPGMSFLDFAETSWPVPNEFEARRYASVAHGVGLCDEWPRVPFSHGTEECHDGAIEPGMTLCVESYIGAEDGVEGVKLEEQILVTDSGTTRLSTFPYEDCFLS